MDSAFSLVGVSADSFESIAAGRVGWISAGGVVFVSFGERG